jgi:hypothetical protein
MWGLWGLIVLMVVMVWALYLSLLLGMYFSARKNIKGIRTLEAARDIDDPATLVKGLDGYVATYTTRTSPFRKESEFDPPPVESLEEYKDFFHYHFLATLEEKAEKQKNGRLVSWFGIALMTGVVILALALWPYDLMSVFLLYLPITLGTVGTVAFIVLNPRYSSKQLELVREVDAKLAAML